MSIREILGPLPDRGWGVLRLPLPAILVLERAGYIKVQTTPHRGVYQARLTGNGRRWVRRS